MARANAKMDKLQGRKFKRYFSMEMKLTNQERILLVYRRPGVQMLDLTNFTNAERPRPAYWGFPKVLTGIRIVTLSELDAKKMPVNFYVMGFLVKTWPSEEKMVHNRERHNAPKKEHICSESPENASYCRRRTGTTRDVRGGENSRKKIRITIMGKVAEVKSTTMSYSLDSNQDSLPKDTKGWKNASQTSSAERRPKARAVKLQMEKEMKNKESQHVRNKANLSGSEEQTPGNNF
ncbi:hypothetical protein CHS0354_030529 [Potamilus streckersoni]|uniref:Uncharacterized protein n=1 Tax=Potamilus streckersoni TaxID=2493646 RepID=A0AAE0VHN4_9BIVA|nr:hypothetical protein CHS0354_030529 [Potamilus streckersoni]